MGPLNQASRLIFCLSKGGVKLKKQPLSTIASSGFFEPVVYTSSTDIPSSTGISNEVSTSDPNKLEKSIPLVMLRKNISPRSGLKYAVNRENLVVNFFNLSKAVMENRISVEDFVATDTFKEVQEQVEYNIDIMNNAQICNLLSSVIKMRINPSMNIVKILEHEVKFRLKSFNLNQIIKMLKFYNSVEMSSEQKQVADMLSFRLRAYTQSDTIQIQDLNSILHLIAAQQAPNTLLKLVEEKMTSILTLPEKEEEDVVMKILSKPLDVNYESLCQVFIRLAENKRRPTPLLKAAVKELCKIPSTKENLELVKYETIVSTLNALVSLNYPNRTLLNKLFNDLTEMIKLEELDSYSKCNLLRTISSLRWRPEKLLEKFFIHNHECTSDQHLTTTLLQVAAYVNYKPEAHSENFFDQYVKRENEEMIDKKSRKWLSYVWSLTALNAASIFHLKSVLDENFYISLANQSSSKLSHSDTMRLLNLRALATYEFKIKDLNCKHLDDLPHNAIQRSVEMQKFASKIDQALTGIVSSPENLSQVETPFGFKVDGQVSMNESNDIVALTEPCLTVPENNSVEVDISNSKTRKCALIYAYYEDTIANTDGEVVGHKKIIARILKSLGYKTAFLPEVVLNREKTSADLSNKIKSLIEASMLNNDKEVSK